MVEVLEDNVLLRYQDRQVITKMKGVSEAFLHQSRLEPFITQGNFKLKQKSESLAMLGNGVQYALSIFLVNQFNMLQVFYPRNIVGNPMLPQQLYTCKSIRSGAVFAVEKQFDESY